MSASSNTIRSISNRSRGGSRTAPSTSCRCHYSICTRDAEHRILRAAQKRGLVVMLNMPLEKARLLKLSRIGRCRILRQILASRPGRSISSSGRSPIRPSLVHCQWRPTEHMSENMGATRCPLSLAGVALPYPRREADSREGCSPDNAACEGLFGRLKTELFYPRKWQATTIDQFIEVVGSYIRWYNEKCIKKLAQLTQSYRIP